MLKIKRVYDPYSSDEAKGSSLTVYGQEGLKRRKKNQDEWLRDVAPSDDLRKWFSHDPSKYQEFKKRYVKELEKKSEFLERIKKEAKNADRNALIFCKGY